VCAARDGSAIQCVDEESEDAQHYKSVMLHYLAGAIMPCVADLIDEQYQCSHAKSTIRTAPMSVAYALNCTPCMRVRWENYVRWSF